MHIDQLIYFTHVVETGSINATAQKYFMTQQAINASLKKLESEVGSPLINRNYKGIELTPQGRIFLYYANQILEQYNESLAQLEQFNAKSNNIVGSLTVFSSSFFAELFLPKTVSDFMLIYPKTNIRILDIPNTEVLSYFFAKYCKLCFITTSKEHLMQMHEKHPNEKIKYMPLLDDELVIVGRPDNTIMKYKKISFNDVEEAFIKENLKFSMYQTYPLNDPENALAYTLSLSSNPEIHKKFMLENIAITYMPKLAYELQFQQEGFSAVTTSGMQNVIHCLLYWDDPEDEDYELITTFITFLKKHFEHRYGFYKGAQVESAQESTSNATP